MPSVTYNGQSFAIDGRRFWIMGASVHYARVPVAEWADRLAAAKQAGFNTIETACPWSLHEPRPDRFRAEGQLDLRLFVTMCAKLGLRVVLRPGPFIGAGYDGGGLPSWLSEMSGLVPREANELFLERVISYFRNLFVQVAELQVTRSLPGSPQQGGPILLVQSEHAWLCSNPAQATKYLREVSRVIRECGINVPLINANDLWQESPGTIDTWRGGEDLLAHLRQLRTVQPESPRLLSSLDAAPMPVWGESPEGVRSGAELMYHVAECLAAGAHAIVSPFAGGTNFGFMGGRLIGGPDRFVATAAAAGAPVGEAGLRGDRYLKLKRIVRFANHFGHVFAELDPEYHPIAIAPPPPPTAGAGSRRMGSAAGGNIDDISVVGLKGPQGSVAFVFAPGSRRKTDLLLDGGVRVPVDLGEQPVGWYIFDADLNGGGRLDYANLMPFALVERSVFVLFGPAGLDGLLSINGSALEVKVPTGARPQVTEHKGLTIVVCNEKQIDATFVTDHAVYVGVDGLDIDGVPLQTGGSEKGWVITHGAEMRSLSVEEVKTPGRAASPARSSRKRRSIALQQWQAASAAGYAEGSSPRYATLDGPASLSACGADVGYGWYRVRFRVSAGRKRSVHLPEAGDRLHLFVDGESAGIVGVGPVAKPGPIDLSLGKGEHVLVALADNLGRFAEGNEFSARKGLFGHILEVRQLRAGKPKTIKAHPVDPFGLRGYLAGLARGQLSDTKQVEWTFTHTRKTPILVQVDGATCRGMFLLNDHPVAYYAGTDGPMLMTLRLSRDEHDSFKRGKNALRFAPDSRQGNACAEISRRTALWECTNELSSGATWSFAKWEPPSVRAFEPVSKTGAKGLRGPACWWKTTFGTPEHLDRPLWFDTRGLSKGQALLNGENLGRYFTSTATGRAVGPQKRLYVPASWLRTDADNELLIFDEHGCDPLRTRLVADAAEELG